MKYNMADPFFFEEDIDSILAQCRDILGGRAMLTMGGQVREFEKEFSRYMGSSNGIATNSCTSALEIALQAVGVREGDEVIVPCQTFIATGSCVAINGARPVFCQIDEDFLLDFEDMKGRITPRTKAVIVVHFAGLVHPRIAEIRDYVKARGICLIEDAAHAHGGKTGGLFAGSIGDIGCYSFYSTKIMTSGEGGIILTNDGALAESCASIRDRGIDVKSKTQIFSRVGSNRRFTEIQALLCRAQLKRLDGFVEHRNMVARTYAEVLEPLVKKGAIRLQTAQKGDIHAYWRFIVSLTGATATRDEIKTALAGHGIAVDWPYDPLLHLQPVFKQMYGCKAGDLRKSEDLAKRHFCIPMHCRITRDDAVFIAEILRDTIA